MPVSPSGRFRLAFATPAFYFAISRIMALALLLFSRWRVAGAGRAPSHGGLLVVANHLSMIDPPLLAASLPRRINFMAKQELFAGRGGLFVRLFGAFPVRRFEADLQALRTARRMLRSGAAVGMFPEGHRSGGAMTTAYPGTAMVALQSGVPILPVAITGSERLRSVRQVLSRPRITVTVGEPFALPSPERIDASAVKEASDRIMRQLSELLPAPYRGVYTYEEVE